MKASLSRWAMALRADKRTLARDLEAIGAKPEIVGKAHLYTAETVFEALLARRAHETVAASISLAFRREERKRPMTVTTAYTADADDN
jgi:hypothetical protein